MRIQDLQVEVHPWLQYNFPRATLEHQGLQLAEETGEVCRAINKAANGYRGTPAEHREALKDAVGDVLISLAAVCAKGGLELETCVVETWAGVRERNWIRYPLNGRTL